MASLTEKNKSFDVQPRTAITPGERARRNKRAGKFLLAVLAGGGIFYVTAPNLATAYQNNKYGPPQKEKVEYTVGSEEGEALVSEIASDMHVVAPHQDQTEADDAIRTYLPKADQKNYTVHPGEHFVFSVDKSSGKILAKPPLQSSAENK